MMPKIVTKMQSGSKRQAQNPNDDQKRTMANPTQPKAPSDIFNVALPTFRNSSDCFLPGEPRGKTS